MTPAPAAPAGQGRALWLSTFAFTVCFAVWTIFAIIGIQIQKANAIIRGFCNHYRTDHSSRTFQRLTYWTLRARARLPARTSNGGMAWVRSTTVVWGASSRITDFTTPTNSSSWPKSERNEMVSYPGMPGRR